MYLISLDMENGIFIIGTETMELRKFEDSEEFLDFMAQIAEDHDPDPYTDDVPDDQIGLSAMLMSGRPLAHSVEDTSIEELLNDETEVMVIAERDGGPFMSLIKCSQSSSAKEWRRKGRDVTSIDKAEGVTMHFRDASEDTFRIQEDKDQLH